MKPRVSKRHYVSIYNNKKEQSLDKYKGKNEKEDIEYISFLLVALSPLFQNKSNHSTNMDKRIKHLNNFIYISKIG